MRTNNLEVTLHMGKIVISNLKWVQVQTEGTEINYPNLIHRR